MRLSDIARIIAGKPPCQYTVMTRQGPLEINDNERSAIERKEREWRREKTPAPTGFLDVLRYGIKLFTGFIRPKP